MEGLYKMTRKINTCLIAGRIQTNSYGAIVIEHDGRSRSLIDLVSQAVGGEWVYDDPDDFMDGGHLEQPCALFVRYYISSEPTTWDNLVENQIRVLSGQCDMSIELAGYSEYTITEVFEDLKVGGHDLYKELLGHEDDYLYMKVT